MGRRTLLALAVWLAAAMAAMLTGLAAVRVIGAGITAGTGTARQPREVAEALASPASGPPVSWVPSPRADPPGPAPDTAGPTPSVSADPTAVPTGRPSPTASAGVLRTLRTPGGTVVARCVAGRVELLSWTPAQGYAARQADRGPSREAEVKFESASMEVEVTVGCAADGPRASWELDD